MLSRLATVSRLGAAITTALVLWAAPARAQGPPRVSPDARGYQTWTVRQDYQRSGVPTVVAVPPPVRKALHRAEAAGLVATMAGAPKSALAYVAVEKAKRESAAAAGPTAVQPHSIVLRPGQSVTIRVMVPVKPPAAPATSSKPK